MHRKRNGQEIPGNWANRGIVYICKNKGEQDEFGNGKPICIAKSIQDMARTNREETHQDHAHYHPS